MSKWTVFIEYLELNQKLYCLEYDDRRIANITKEQFEDFEQLLSTEQPPAGDFTKKTRITFTTHFENPDWVIHKKLMEALVIIDRSEAGERILEERIEKLSDTLDRSEASRKDLLTVCKEALSLVESDYRGHSDWVGPGITLGPKLEAAIAKAKEVKI